MPHYAKPFRAALISTQPSEIRKDYYLNRYVIISPKRNLRPSSFTPKSGGGHKTETATSPAIEKEPGLLEIKDESGRWRVKVIANDYPALSLDNEEAYGKQEVVIETPNHNTEFSELTTEHIGQVFTAYIERLKTLSKIKGIKYISVFKNDGPKAGASIAHAHSQIMALPLVPPEIEEEAAAFESYYVKNKSCPICDIVNWEVQQKVRVIFEDKNIIALAPYSSILPFQVWLVPRMHVASFTKLSLNQLDSFAVILKRLTAQLDLAKISFNFFLQEPAGKKDHHFILNIEPRANIWAGLELSTGIIINPVSPEYAALWYQGKVT